MNDKQVQALKAFENKHHPEIWQWILHKVEHDNDDNPVPTENLDMLDVSEDPSIFSLLLAEKYKPNKLVCAVRGDLPGYEPKPPIEVHKISIENDNFEELIALGQFDIIILKEMTHEVTDLGAFFKALNSMLKSLKSKIFLLTRPKNPPLPVPDVCMVLWRKYAPTREQIIEATHEASMRLECYSASCPIKIEKMEWREILRSGCFPPVRNTKKCSDKEIRDFIDSRSKVMNFEEKILIFVLTPRTGDTPEPPPVYIDDDE